MKSASIVLILWLIVGAAAGAQRHDYTSSPKSCTSAATIVVTVLAGPLNYLGVNPKVQCHAPQPSH